MNYLKMSIRKGQVSGDMQILKVLEHEEMNKFNINTKHQKIITIKNIPDKIYLQLGIDNEADGEYDFNELF
jgi:hypothetical protein